MILVVPIVPRNQVMALQMKMMTYHYDTSNFDGGTGVVLKDIGKERDVVIMLVVPILPRRQTAVPQQTKMITPQWRHRSIIRRHHWEGEK